MQNQKRKKVIWYNVKASAYFLFIFNRCVRVTDVGVIAIAEGCTSLEFLR